MTEADEMRRAWGRVVRWLEQNAPGSAAALSPPVGPKAISDAEERLGVKFPQEVWTWLLINDGVRTDDQEYNRFPAEGGGFLPSSWHLLSVDQMVRVYEFRMGCEEREPTPDGDLDCVTWHRDWVPFAAESDWLYGRFIDTRAGTLGRWSDGGTNQFDTHGSLAEFFHELADEMRTQGPGRVVDGVLTW
ncbi:SMI1/KNR4 family protein [Streptomyces sp. NPDC057239]|uniref:SMI1/KNR4 family protein n=1 Tax=Streptomyces sp. NPDC057239 TaxID=3346061 RepID=UPI003636E3DC